MKKLRLLAFSLCIILLMLTVTGCQGFFASEDEEKLVSIKSITSKLLEDGRTMVTITYTDEKVSPTNLYIPKGDKGTAGIDGVGIADITYTKSGAQTVVTVQFTDPHKEPVKFAVNDGISIVGINVDRDDDGNKYLEFKYSNDKTSDKILLPKGDTGVGIDKYEEIVNETDKSVVAKFTLTDGTEHVIHIPAPQRGNGITKIESKEDGDSYMLYIYYDDTVGEPEPIRFTRPKDPNQWLYGSSKPSNENDGADGDYYFDTFHKNIYHKEDGNWALVIGFNTAETNYTVRFHLNDDDSSPAYFENDTKLEYTVKYGSYFSNDGSVDIPIPRRDGYKFIGWYTNTQPNATTGAFTDLTPILSDLDLYAVWEKK